MFAFRKTRAKIARDNATLFVRRFKSINDLSVDFLNLKVTRDLPMVLNSLPNELDRLPQDLLTPQNL